MGEQLRGEDWLPEGWKVEIRVRKTGKKDRYYTDPVHGYIFRSLKDIDRYLITGKLGRHVTKFKPKDSGSSDVKLEIRSPPLKQDAPKKKKSIKSNGTKKSSFAAREQKPAGNASKQEDTKAQNSKETAKKKITSNPSKGKTSKPSKKRESTPFFILDSDQCEEDNAVDIPNLMELIDSIQKEREGRNMVYVSAPAIGALLGEQKSEVKIQQVEDKKPPIALPQIALGLRANIKPNGPVTASESHMEKKDISESKISPHQDPSSSEKCSKMDDTKSDNKEEPESQFFGDLLNDPCFDFAVKTLTGAIDPLGSEPKVEDCFLQQQLGSVMDLKGGSPSKS